MTAIPNPLHFQFVPFCFFLLFFIPVTKKSIVFLYTITFARFKTGCIKQ